MTFTGTEANSGEEGDVCRLYGVAVFLMYPTEEARWFMVNILHNHEEGKIISVEKAFKDVMCVFESFIDILITIPTFTGPAL